MPIIGWVYVGRRDDSYVKYTEIRLTGIRDDDDDSRLLIRWLNRVIGTMNV